MDEANLIRRAFAAYFKHGAEHTGVPSENASRVVTHQGLTYVVLANETGTLATYRVRTPAPSSTTSGPLRLMKRPPAAVLGEVS
jgi:hypothetical protein